MTSFCTVPEYAAIRTAGVIYYPGNFLLPDATSKYFYQQMQGTETRCSLNFDG